MDAPTTASANTQALYVRIHLDTLLKYPCLLEHGRVPTARRQTPQAASRAASCVV